MQVAELSGPAAALLSSMSPAQVSIVAEALGKACVKDAELYGKISTQVRAVVHKLYSCPMLTAVLHAVGDCQHCQVQACRAGTPVVGLCRRSPR